MEILYPLDTRDPVMLAAWRRMIMLSQWLKHQPRDENKDTIIVPGHENPEW